MKEYFAYIRVSTLRQGLKGVSLAEQRAAIERFAERERLEIREWFEERETAAKRGRTVFSSMLKRLKTGEVAGVLIHKIDRSARNLRDWADLGDLIDAGIEVRFVTESLDLHSRGGRLSADIQAVVAADYIRNLREETRKGFYGRLKQGIYPLAAPIGYLDNGGGKLKTPDPERAPLIRDAFRLYATGSYTLKSLAAHLEARGLRSKTGKPVSYKRLAEFLKNPFYAGIIKIRTTGEVFKGAHEPLISQAVFDQVQDVLAGRVPLRTYGHDFLFKRLLRCAKCGMTLTGERQKGHVYYRCHSPACHGTSVREDAVATALQVKFARIELPQALAREIEQHLPDSDEDWGVYTRKNAATIELRLKLDRARLDRLTDALIDGVIDRGTHDERRSRLVRSINASEQELADLGSKAAELRDRFERFFELWKSLNGATDWANPDKFRETVLEVTSNRLVHQKNVEFKLSEPFRTVENIDFVRSCAHSLDSLRTTVTTLMEYMEGSSDSNPPQARDRIIL